MQRFFVSAKELLYALAPNCAAAIVDHNLANPVNPHPRAERNLSRRGDDALLRGGRVRAICRDAVGFSAAADACGIACDTVRSERLPVGISSVCRQDERKAQKNRRQRDPHPFRSSRGAGGLADPQHEAVASPKAAVNLNAPTGQVKAFADAEEAAAGVKGVTGPTAPRIRPYATVSDHNLSLIADPMDLHVGRLQPVVVRHHSNRQAMAMLLVRPPTEPCKGRDETGVEEGLSG